MTWRALKIAITPCTCYPAHSSCCSRSWATHLGQITNSGVRCSLLVMVFCVTHLIGNLDMLGFSACTGGEEGRPGAGQQRPWGPGRRRSEGGVHQAGAQTGDSRDQSRQGFESCPESCKKTQKHVLQSCLAGWHHFWVCCGCKYIQGLFLLFSLSLLLENHHKRYLIGV